MRVRTKPGWPRPQKVITATQPMRSPLSTPKPRDRSLIIGRIRTRILEIDGEGPVVLLLHGFSDHRKTWVPLLRELGRYDMRAIAVDLPGFGQADPLSVGEVLPQYDRFVAQLIEKFAGQGEPGAILVGNSLGGALALRAGQDSQHNIGGIVPISPAGFDHSSFIRRFERLPAGLDKIGLGLIPAPMFRRLAGRGYAKMGTGGSNYDALTIDAYSAQFRSRRDIRRVFSPARAILAELPGTYQLSLIKAPVLLIWGQRDRLTLVSGSQRIAAELPETEVVILPHAGHCSQFEEPDVIADFIDIFVRRIKPPVP